MRRTRAGFTLIELLIVVTVIAVLMAVALPGYQGNLRKSNRAAAQNFLMDVAARQQQYMLDARSFAASLAELGMDALIPADVSRFYTISLAAAVGPPPTFTVTATPLPGTYQASDPVLTLDNRGVKTPSDKW